MLSEITLSTLVKLMSRKAWGGGIQISLQNRGLQEHAASVPGRLRLQLGAEAPCYGVTQARQLPNSPPERRLLGCGGNSGTLTL